MSRRRYIFDGNTGVIEDDDLLVLESFREIPILAAGMFLQRIGRDDP